MHDRLRSRFTILLSHVSCCEEDLEMFGDVPSVRNFTRTIDRPRDTRKRSSPRESRAKMTVTSISRAVRQSLDNEEGPSSCAPTMLIRLGTTRENPCTRYRDISSRSRGTSRSRFTTSRQLSPRDARDAFGVIFKAPERRERLNRPREREGKRI